MDKGNLATCASAISTFILALVTIAIVFIGDSYTRLIKKTESIKFKKAAFEFLRETFSSVNTRAEVPNLYMTIEQNIERFNHILLSKKIYLSTVTF